MSYNFSLTTFSPSGKLVQIEHALNAVAQGVTAIGIKGMPIVVTTWRCHLYSPLWGRTNYGKEDAIGID